MSLKTEDSKTKAAKSDNVTDHGVDKASSPDSTSTDTFEASQTVVSTPSKGPTAVAPTSKGVTSKKPIRPATSTTPSTDDDTRSLNIGNVTLLFDTIDGALSDGLMGREPLTIENDDVTLVKNARNSKAWVKKLIEAFGQDYLAQSEDTSKDKPKQKEWFARWQKQAHLSVITIVETKDPAHLEKSCWHLFHAVVKAHELGVINPANRLTPSELKCSERLAFIVSIIEKYALVRLDVLRAWHVDEIAANPEAFIKRKITNCWNNGHRAERSKIAKDEKAAGKKRVVHDDDGQAEQSGVQTPVMGKKARKLDAASGEMENEVASKNKSSTELSGSEVKNDGTGNSGTGEED